VDASALEHLSREECLVLLAGRGVGRFAVAVPDASPFVVPVNYVLDGEIVVFRSGPGSKLRALRGSPVSFQLDEIDPVHRTGWSVLMRGRAYEATHWEVGHLDLTAWTPDEKSHWVRLVPDAITGRRIRRLDGFVDLGGYL
jgi:nitroimidazol reductase NimA-like FMN-containing flavoprotein (pyridoxamine 5'-phosphate oxidase superfamily)